MKIVKISRQEALTICRASFLKQKKNNFLKKWLILKLKYDTIYIKNNKGEELWKSRNWKKWQ